MSASRPADKPITVAVAVTVELRTDLGCLGPPTSL